MLEVLVYLIFTYVVAFFFIGGFFESEALSFGAPLVVCIPVTFLLKHSIKTPLVAYILLGLVAGFVVLLVGTLYFSSGN